MDMMHWPTSQGTWEEKKKRKKTKQNKPMLNKWQYNGENKMFGLEQRRNSS